MSIKSIIKYKGAIITLYAAGLVGVSYGGIAPFYVDNIDIACKCVDADLRSSIDQDKGC